MAEQYDVWDAWLSKVCKVLRVPRPGSRLLNEEARWKAGREATAAANTSVITGRLPTESASYRKIDHDLGANG